MFFLRGRGGNDSKFNVSPRKDEFGWWLNEEDTARSLNSRLSSNSSSTGSSSPTMVSCIDSDDMENYTMARGCTGDNDDHDYAIEFTTPNQGDLDVDLIEKDAIRQTEDITPVLDTREPHAVLAKGKPRSQKFQGISYTPERLVRSQEYRILTPSPRYLSISQASVTHGNESPRQARRCRRRLTYLIDSKQLGATKLNALLNPSGVQVLAANSSARSCQACQRVCDTEKVCKSHEKNANLESLSSPEGRQSMDFLTASAISKHHNGGYHKLNSTWNDSKQPDTTSSSLDHTSGIESSEWSSESNSDSRDQPPCLCDELASANFGLDFSKERVSAINEVASILEVLETQPDKAAILLEEDRFCDSASSHDQFTRLALAIEPDANVPAALEDQEHFIHQLQRKVEKLQVNSRDIFQDICGLRKNLQCDEEKVAEISSDATKLRQDIHEMLYLDDLLNLLQGELERISRRNWPFLLGRTAHHFEEMNLIV